MFGYKITNLQQYFDKLPADTTKIVVDYGLLSWFHTRHVKLYNEDPDLMFDLTRFANLTHFEYNLCGLKCTRKYSTRVFFCLSVALDQTTMRDYFPIFRFHPNAPLQYICIPNITWGQYQTTFKQLANFPTITTSIIGNSYTFNNNHSFEKITAICSRMRTRTCMRPCNT